jgi:predicted HTH domain antitoxin
VFLRWDVLHNQADRIDDMTMRITSWEGGVELLRVAASSNHLPDAAQCSPQQFMQDAKLAMAIKLFEMKRLSSGMAALLIGITRVQFLGELHRFGVPMIDLDESELGQDILNA